MNKHRHGALLTAYEHVTIWRMCIHV
jgi:hypothetical protein